MAKIMESQVGTPASVRTMRRAALAHLLGWVGPQRRGADGDRSRPPHIPAGIVSGSLTDVERRQGAIQLHGFDAARTRRSSR